MVRTLNVYLRASINYPLLCPLKMHAVYIDTMPICANTLINTK